MAHDNKLPVWELMSPAMRSVVEKSTELAAGANDTSEGFEAMRAAYRTERRYWNEGGPVMARTDEAVVGTPNGDVAVRLHRPSAAAEGGPAIVYLHGGGFILGDLDTHDRIMRLLAAETGATVVGVDYALSPEAKFPVALRQCAAVVRQLHDEGAAFGVDGDRLALAGDSGGASLSLGVFLYLRQVVKDVGFVRALLLYYGLFGLQDSASRRLLGGPWDGLTKADLDYYMDMYLASPDDMASPYIDLLGADLGGVPPSFIASAELDPLRDDSFALATMLRTREVRHRHIMYKGVLHAFLHNSRQLSEAMDALRDGAEFFRDVLNGDLSLSTNQTDD